jgi:transcriptional regulator with XRE-family HTH domain
MSKNVWTPEAEALLDRVRLGTTLLPADERKRIRTDAGISTRDLGSAVGVSFTAIANWENGGGARHKRNEFKRYMDLLRAIDRELRRP